MVTIHKEPLCIRYKVNKVSCASCCNLIYGVLLILLPYIIAYVTGGFWSSDILAREQPFVRFRHEALVEAYASSTSPSLIPLGWSSSALLNSALGSTLRPSELRAWTEDDDRNGRVESLVFSLRVPLGSDERIHSVSLMLGLEVILDQATSLRMNSTVYVQHSSPLPGLRSSQTADLLLESTRALRSSRQPARAPCREAFWMLQVRTTHEQVVGKSGQRLALCACADTDTSEWCALHD